MNQIKISFSNKTEMFHFLENIGYAQSFIADHSDREGVTPENLFAIMALSTIQIQASKQMAEYEMNSDRGKTVITYSENPQ